MKLFLQLLEKSVIVRGALVIIVTAGMVFLLCSHQTVPAELWVLIGAAWSWFFSSGAPKDLQTVLSKERNRRATDPR